MLCDEVLDHFEKIIGEPVFPHMYLYNAAQMNVGKVGGDGPVDQWHFDSVNFVAVTLLSDITDMKVNCFKNFDPTDHLSGPSTGRRPNRWTKSIRGSL